MFDIHIIDVADLGKINGFQITVDASFNLSQKAIVTLCCNHSKNENNIEIVLL